MVDIHQAASVVHNPIVSIALTIGMSGSLWTALSVANDLENAQNATDQRQEMIIQTQQEIKAELKEQDEARREMRDLLIEIKTKMEAE